MKYLIAITLMLVSFSCCIASCEKAGIPVAEQNDDNNHNNDTMVTKMKITIGAAAFTATLNNSATAMAFKAKLPMTIGMTELNGNEKYFDLADALPVNAVNPGTIENGDLMLYGSKTLVLFYKTFSTSYNYTRLGHIDNASELANALGSGNVAVTFEVE